MPCSFAVKVCSVQFIIFYNLSNVSPGVFKGKSRRSSVQFLNFKAMKKVNYLKALCLGGTFAFLLLTCRESYLGFGKLTKTINAIIHVQLAPSLVNFYH